MDTFNGKCLPGRQKSTKCIIYQGTNHTSLDIHYGQPLNLVIDALTEAIGDSGNGDMLASVYDPNGVNGDAFDYENFSNTPTIPSTPQDIGAQPAGNYATQGDIPTDNAGLTNGAGYVTTDTTYTAGDNISINGSNEISATNTDTTYTAGDNIDITDEEISVTGLSAVATSGNASDLNNDAGFVTSDTTYSAGDNIAISTSNEISVTGLGSAAEEDSSAFATSAQGGLADSAVQPSDLGNLADITIPTTDPADGESIWLDGSTLKIASQP